MKSAMRWQIDLALKCYVLEHIFVLDIFSNKCFDLTDRLGNVFYNLGFMNRIFFPECNCDTINEVYQ